MSEIIDIRFVTNAPEYAAESKRIEQAITGVERRTGAMSKEAVESSRKIEESGKRVDGMYKQLSSTLAKFGGTIVVATLAKQLYDFANAFDLSMREVATISQTVANNMDSFNRQVLELGTRVPIAADAAGKALYQIVSAGYDGAAGMNLLEVSAKSAIAGMTDTTTAADAITTSLNAYKMSAEEAAKVSDLLFMTAKLGKTTFGQLGQSISQAAPIAAAYGVELEQVLAAVSTLTKSGTPTAQAMTQIRATIISVSKYLGDGAFDTMTFQEALNMVAQKANGSEDALRGMITETEAISGVLGLTGINARMAADDLAAMGAAAGETEKAFALMVDAADAQLAILKNNMLKKFHEMGAVALDSGTNIATALNQAFETGAMDDVIATLGVLIAMFGTYKAALIAASVYQKAMAATEMLRTLNQTTTALRRTTQAQILLNQAMGANPVAKLISLLMAAGTALYMFSDKAKTTRDVISDLDTSSDQYDKTVKSLNGSISRYDELQHKAKISTGLTKDEHAELNSIMETMLSTVPNLKGKFDEYGNTLSVNIDVVKSYSKTQKDAYKDVLQANIQSAEQEKKMLEGKLEMQRKIFQEGKKLTYENVVDGQVGETTIYKRVEKYVDASAKDMQQARAEWSRLNSELIDIGTSITNSKNVIDGINDTLNDGDGGEQNTATPQMYGVNYRAARKEWEIAKTELLAIEKDKDSFTQKQYDDAKKRATDAEAAYNAMGGVTKSPPKNDKSVSDKFKNNQSKIEAERALKDALVDVMFETEQAIIDAGQNSYDKEMAQIELNYRKKQAVIELWEREQRKIVIDAQKSDFIAKGGKEENFKADYNDAAYIMINKAYEARMIASNAERTTAEKQLNDQHIEIYKSYEEKRTEIKQKYADDRNIIEKSGLDPKIISDKLALATKAEEKELSELRKQQVEESGIWIKLFDNFSTVSTSSLRSLFDDAQEQIRRSTDLSAEDLQKLTDRLNEVREEIIRRNPFTELKTAYEAYIAAKKRGDKKGTDEAWGLVVSSTKGSKELISNIGQSLSGLTGVFNKELPSVIEKTVSIINDGITAFEVFGKTGEKSAGDTVKGMSGIISIITTIAGLVINAFDDTTELAARQAEANRRQEGYWASINFQVERYIKMLDQASGNDYFDISLRTIDAINNGLDNAKNAITNMPKGQVDEITMLQSILSDGGNIDGLFFFSKANKDDAKEIYSIVKDINYEEAIALKNNAELWSKIPEWQQNAIDKYIEYNEQLGDLQEKLDKDLLQTTSSDMENSILQWLKTGEDGIDDIGKYLEDTMRNALLQSFVIEQLRPKLKELYSKYREYADSNEDGKLDLDADEMSQLKQDWNDMLEWSQKETEGIIDLFGGSKSKNEDSLTGAIRGNIATGQSVSELGGIFRGQWDTAKKIEQSLDLGFAQVAESIRIQVAIEANTRRTADNTGFLIAKADDTNKKLDEIVKNTKSDVYSR